MSNVIKSSMIKVDDGESNSTNSLEPKKLEVKQIGGDVESIATSLDEKQTTSDKEDDEIQPLVTKDLATALKEKEQMLRDQEANLKVKYQNIIEAAENKADEIMDDARKLAMDMKNEAIDVGRREGYNQGLSQAAEEIDALKQELIMERQTYQDEYDNKVEQFEKDFISVFTIIAEKMFGVIIDDKQDVMIHIINRTLTDAERSENYVIRVSREDYELVTSKKQMLYDYVTEGASIEIIESDNLTHNKCLIETDNSVIDCSVDTQVKNLMADLEMLSKF